jgi:hypothetical protein
MIGDFVIRRRLFGRYHIKALGRALPAVRFINRRN